MQNDSQPPSYTIEARSLSVAGIAGHDFWVLRGPDGRAIAELHGLATDRRNGEYVAIGTDPERFSLRAWHLVHDTSYAASLGITTDDATFIRDSQPHRTVLRGPKDEILARWNHAALKVPQLNALDLDYPANGFTLFGKTVNSNSAYRTFGEIMDVPVQGFPGRIEPGLDNRMLPKEEIEKLRYQPGASEHGVQERGALPPAMPASRIEHANLHAMPPTDSQHPDHHYFKALRDAIPAHIGDHEVAYAMLKAKQGGVVDASQLDTTRIAVSDRTIFVIGTTPGFRSRIDLPDTPLTMEAVTTQLQHANAVIARPDMDLPARERVIRV